MTSRKTPTGRVLKSVSTELTQCGSILPVPPTPDDLRKQSAKRDNERSGITSANSAGLVRMYEPSQQFRPKLLLPDVSPMFVTAVVVLSLAALLIFCVIKLTS